MAADKFENAFPESAQRMPAVFIGHGSPMNAVEDNPFSRAWAEVGKALPRPKAILCISAHWETRGTQVTAMPQPRTIHDFYGFPPELYGKRYPAPGSPALARLVQQTLQPVPVQLDQGWGLDHGTWSVLCRAYPIEINPNGVHPQADIPVVQLSLDTALSPIEHYALAKKLVDLRRRGVLILGSGNMVHNLGRAVFEERAYDWAVQFDETLRGLILAGDHEALIHYERLGVPAQLSIPTNEHYLPLLYVLAQQAAGEGLSFFAEGVTLGSISMRSVRVG